MPDMFCVRDFTSKLPTARLPFPMQLYEKLIPYYKLFSHISPCPWAINLHYTVVAAAATVKCYAAHADRFCNFELLNEPLSSCEYPIMANGKRQETAPHWFLLIWSFKINCSPERKLSQFQQNSDHLEPHLLRHYWVKQAGSPGVFLLWNCLVRNFVFSSSWISYEHIQNFMEAEEVSR